jgi:hypothetical protein
MNQPGGRRLYINSTSHEVRRIAWVGNRQDGMASLVRRFGLPAKINDGSMTIHFKEIDSWIYCLGADDAASVQKALGGAYHEVWWDEAQKIPARLNDTIEQVIIPTLLDFDGVFRLTGSPSLDHTTMFYNITRPERDMRLPGWDVYEWNMLCNPFFGATEEERHRRGIMELVKRYGAAGIDDPRIQRDGFGIWTYEDASYVYPMRRVPAWQLYYAPHRGDPFNHGMLPNVAQALADLPGWGSRDYHLAAGFDLGFHPDPFAFTIWAWSLKDPNLYEVASWRKTKMTSDEQVAAIQELRKACTLGIMVADASGGGRPVVAGWAQGWRERNPIPIIEAEKHNKHLAMEAFGNDIEHCRVKFRNGSPLVQELFALKWATILSATGKRVEDPTIPNDVADSGLYAHRHSYHHRFREPEPVIQPGSPEHLLRMEEEMEQAADEHASNPGNWWQ